LGNIVYDICGIIGTGMTYVVVFSLIILATAFFSRMLEQKSILDPVVSRKILHIVAIALSAVSVFYIPTNILKIIVSACLPILIFIVYKDFFRDPETGRKSWGIVYFNLIFALLLFLFPNAPELIFYPLIVLALADGMAAAVGVTLGRKNGKTIQGSTAFFLASVGIFVLSPHFYTVPSLPFQTIIILSVSLTVVEFITKKSLDNLTVPIAVLYWLYVDHLSSDLAPFIFAVIALGCWSIYKLKWLDLEGSLLAGIIALVYLSSPFPEALIPGFIFFITGSILSKLPKGKSAEDSRSAMQVFSNGGPALIAICMYFTTYENAWFSASIVSFAAAISDTSSSELGVRFGSQPLDIIGLKKLEKGASGGISFVGILAGMAASVFLVLITSLFIPLTFKEALFIAAFGFTGNIIDSLLGSIVQTKWLRGSTGIWSDSKMENSKAHSGISWFDNNITNLVSVSSVTILSYFIFLT